MTTQKAIEKAIEGGWLPHKAWKGIERKAIIKWCSQGEMHISFVVMQRSFWQALGKSMGWKKRSYRSELSLPHTVDGDEYGGGYWDGPEYLYRWHGLIEHLDDRKSIEDYFKDLGNETKE